MLQFKQMIWIDYSIVAIIGLYLIIGLARGAGKEMIALLAWLLAIGIGWYFAQALSLLLVDHIQHSAARLAASFVGLVVLTRLLVSTIFFLGRERGRKPKVNWLGHLSGMCIGLLRGVVVVAVIVLLGGLTPLPKDDWWRESRLIPPFQSSAIWLKHHLPSGFSGQIHFG